VRSRWLDIGEVIFVHVYELRAKGTKVHKHTLKERGQYPAILTKHELGQQRIDIRKKNTIFLQDTTGYLKRARKHHQAR